MKNIDKEEDKKDWLNAELNTICSVNYGTRVVQKRDGGSIYPVYGGGGATFFMDTFNRENCFIVSRFAMSKKCTRFVKQKFFLNDSGLSVETKDKMVLTQNYLDKQLEYLNDEIYSLARGTAQKNLDVDAFRKIQIYYPKKLSEQQAIVEKLDFAFDAIEKAKANIEKNIENAKELFQSKLNEIFSQKGEGWEEKTLKSISTDFGRGKSKHRPRNFDKLYGGKYPFIQTGDIRNAGMYVLEHTQTYSDLGLAQSKLWPKNTICITIAANIAESAITTFECCFPDSVIGLIVDENKANIFYTYYALQFLKSDIQSKSVGFAQQNINLATFDRQFFPFPKALTEQNRYVKQLDQLLENTNILQEKYKQKIANLEEMKKSILEKAFKGDLVSIENQ